VLRVDVAMDIVTGQNVGYCVSSVDEERTGEIESISLHPIIGVWELGIAL
jgi:hypothetical protein